MKVGYVRVSTCDQNPARQVEALQDYGTDRIFEEKVSGKNLNRPGLKDLLGFIRDGDTVVVESYSRLAQFERECTLQRQAEGIAIAKAEGKYKGRRPIAKPTEWDYVISLYRAKEITAAQAQRRLGLSHATFYRMLNKIRTGF